MIFTEEKSDLMIVTLVCVLLGGLVFMSKESSSLQGLNGEVSYEMPRPKSFWASLFGLGLDDREIERKYVNPFEKEKEKLESKKNAQEKGESKPVPLAAKKTEQPKKEPEVTQKPQVNIAVVGDGDEGVGSEDSGVLYGGKSASRLSRTIQTRSGNESKLGGRGRGSIGSDQLRDLILSQPTKENVARLISGYMSRELTDSAYYSIISELLKDNRPEAQDAGLYLVASFYSSNGFFTVASAFDNLGNENQKKAQNYLMSYSTGRRTQLLIPVLKTNDMGVLEMATHVVLKSYVDSKNSSNGIISDPRSSRGDTALPSSPIADFQKFIPIFESMSQSSDSGISSLGSSALNQIQTDMVPL